MEESEVYLARRFADIARLLDTKTDVQETLQEIADLALDITRAEHAGIDYVEGRTIRPVAPTSEIAHLVDEIQVELGEGPCLDALSEHGTFRTNDLSKETRWPEFSRLAHERTGIKSVMGFRLFVEEGTMGALNLYSPRAEAFDARAEAIGEIYAAHASVALSAAKTEEQLRKAIQSRDVIGQAKGVLMAWLDISADDAYELLGEASGRHDVRVVEIARLVVERDRAAAEQLLQVK